MKQGEGRGSGPEDYQSYDEKSNNKDESKSITGNVIFE